MLGIPPSSANFNTLLELQRKIEKKVNAWLSLLRRERTKL